MIKMVKYQEQLNVNKEFMVRILHIIINTDVLFVDIIIVQLVCNGEMLDKNLYLFLL